MQTLEQSLKNLAVNHKVEFIKAIAIVKPIDEERKETIELLKRVERQVGMTLGEEILSHIAKIEGRKFNSLEYNYERPNGEQ